MTVSKLTTHAAIEGKKTAKGYQYYSVEFENGDKGKTLKKSVIVGSEYEYDMDGDFCQFADTGGQSTYTSDSNKDDEIRKAVALKAAVEYCAQRSDKSEEDVMLMAAKYYNWLKDGLPF